MLSNYKMLLINFEKNVKKGRVKDGMLAGISKELMAEFNNLTN